MLFRGGVEDTTFEAKDSKKSKVKDLSFEAYNRPRTSKCVLEAKDVLEDSTSGVVPDEEPKYVYSNEMVFANSFDLRLSILPEHLVNFVKAFQFPKLEFQ